MLKTTIGQLLVNESLPPDMRDYTRRLDKQGVRALFQELAERHPDAYREVNKRLLDIGRDAAYTSGGNSFGLRHLHTSKAAIASRQRLNRRIREILSHADWDDDKREAKIVEAADAENTRISQEILDEAVAEDNPLGKQVLSGARGNASQLKRLLGGDLLYMDHRDNVIPLPVQTSYSEGLPPAEWFAGTFGARRGLVGVKFATQDAGFASKQLNQAAHRLVVTGDDADEEESAGTLRGLPVDVADSDSEGSLLAAPVGDYARNTVITPRILKELRNAGHKRILVRSPVVGGPQQGGVSARDVGVRERGDLPPLGDNVGLAAAQALSEVLTQGQLSSKHSGGVKGTTGAATGFVLVNQLMQVPKRFKGGASHAQLDGRVDRIVPAPAGGNYVVVNGQQHYIANGFEPLVKLGDAVEAGDAISDGLPNPAEVVRHKGVGEGRRYFTQAFARAYRDSGMGANRRNIELLARGLIDHVELVDDHAEHSIGDVVPYSTLERNWRPRDGYQTLPAKRAVGKYLERPVLHYSIGTRVRPSVVRDMDEFGVTQLDVHDDEPPFQPRRVRAMEGITHDPDWMSRLLGSYQKKSLLEGARRGAISDTSGTSFVPSLAAGTEFGKQAPQLP